MVSFAVVVGEGPLDSPFAGVVLDPLLAFFGTLTSIQQHFGHLGGSYFAVVGGDFGMPYYYAVGMKQGHVRMAFGGTDSCPYCVAFGMDAAEQTAFGDAFAGGILVVSFEEVVAVEGVVVGVAAEAVEPEVGLVAVVAVVEVFFQLA